MNDKIAEKPKKECFVFCHINLIFSSCCFAGRCNRALSVACLLWLDTHMEHSLLFLLHTSRKRGFILESTFATPIACKYADIVYIRRSCSILVCFVYNFNLNAVYIVLLIHTHIRSVSLSILLARLIHVVSVTQHVQRHVCHYDGLKWI